MDAAAFTFAIFKLILILPRYIFSWRKAKSIV